MNPVVYFMPELSAKSASLYTSVCMAVSDFEYIITCYGVPCRYRNVCLRRVICCSVGADVFLASQGGR